MRLAFSNSATRSLTFLLLFLLVAVLPPSGNSVERVGISRAASMVHFDVFSTRVSSDAISGWENFIIGTVNRTTTIETRLVNDIDAPLNDVEVTCTSYWYEGNYPDRGHIIFREMILVDLPSGKGSSTSKIVFRWTPTISGSYILNISAHVPGDARPMSTDPIFLQGKKYEQEGKGYFYSGVWVAREYWDCSSYKGWVGTSDGGSIGEVWRPVIHPRGEQEDQQHSAPWTFWAGDIVNGTAPLNGTHSLVSPELDLEGFSPNPYDIEIGGRRPQIYLLYRYRGNLTPMGDGRGKLYHLISTDGGTSWRPLNDSRGMQIVVTGSTPEGYWSYITRPPAYGSNPLIGMDMGAYLGKKVRLRLDLVPSGLNETGVLIDDIVLMGIERLEERPFSLGPPSKVGIDVEPSGTVSFSFNVTNRKWRSDLVLRFEAVNASGYLSMERDIKVEPDVLRIPAGTVLSTSVRVNATIPKGAISGPGRILVRAAGGGYDRDMEMTFDVQAVHKVISSIEGNVQSTIEPGTPIPISVLTENTGNIRERVELTFVTGSDLAWDRPRRTVVLDPGRSFITKGNLSVALGSPSGPKKGFFVISPIAMPPDQEVLARVVTGNADADWTVFPVTYTSRQFHDIRLISSGKSHYIDDPPEEGNLNLTYNLFLMNSGNGDDEVSFSCSDLVSREGMTLVLPDNITMGANDTRVVDVRVNIEFPLPDGIYNLTIMACSSGAEDTSDNSVELLLIVGRPPVSRGIYLLNGSLEVRPENVIKGQDAIFFFKVRAFGYLQPVQFTINLLLDGVQFDTGVFTSSLIGVKEYQFIIRFQDHGTREVSLVLADAMPLPVPGGELRRSLNLTIQVHFIEIAIDELGLDGRTGWDLNRTFSLGEHDIQALVRNLGDMVVGLVTVHLTVQEVSEPENRTVIVLNVSDLGPGSSSRLELRFRTFRPGTTYHVTLSFQDRGLWKESNSTNDLQTMVVVIGEEEPPVPFWRVPMFLYITGGVVLIALIVLSYLLIRKGL